MKCSFSAPPLPQEDNLVFKAIKAVRKIAGVPYLRVRIFKSIPFGGGLGGGSSNAAAALRYANRFAQLSREQLSAIALELGADVPFFLNGNSASWVTGIGEIRNSLRISSDVLEHLKFILILPPFGSETRLVFQRYQSRSFPFSEPSLSPEMNFEVDELFLKSHLDSMRNDLVSCVDDPNEVIRSGIRRLLDEGALAASMTGSGSTVFGVYWCQTFPQKTVKDLGEFCRQNNCRLVTASTHRHF